MTSTAPARAAALTGRERMLRAARGQPVDRVPVWLMRQAGRYLPEYRAVRERSDFLTMVKTPALALEVTLQPLRRFPLDAAIVFSDIMVPVEAMGLGLAFDPGPVIDPPVRTRADVERLRAPEHGEGMEYLAEAVRLVRHELGGDRALLGFAGAPLTLATYLCEGRAGGAKELLGLRRLLHADPAAAHALLEKLGRVVAGSLSAQIESGADMVQLFDTWAGILDPADYAAFGLPHARAVVDAVHARHPATPVIYFARGAAALLDGMAATGAGVIGLDWPADLASARRRLGPRPVQGNLDPALLLAPPAALEARARAILAAGGGTGHIFNLGHGVLPETAPEQVARLVEVVHDWVPPAPPKEPLA